jgi:hypothetical protein
MTIMAIHTPGLDDPVGVPIFAWPPYMIDDTIASASTTFAHLFGDFSKRLLPGNPFPLPLTALAYSFERIQDPLRIIDLIVSGRTLCTVSSAAARMSGIPFKLANLVRFFVYVSQEPAGRFAIEANSGHKRVASRHSLRPGFAIPFHPVIPYFGRRVLADPSIGMDNLCEFERLAVRGGKLRSGSAGRGSRNFFCHRFSILVSR